jgi:hypothetical protein
MRSLVVAVVALSAWVAQAKPPAPAANTGTLVIASTTDGAEVFIDGEKVGVVPLPGPLTISTGDHTVKVQKPGFAPLIDVFAVHKKHETRLEVELVPVSGVLRVRANVEQARVFVDGKLVGDAPITVEIEVGERAIKVQKGGYKEWTGKVSSVAGQEAAVEVKLEELPVGFNPYKPPPPPPPKWFEKWWVWTVGGAAVVVAVTAVVVPVTLARRNPVDDFCSHSCQQFVVTVPGQ